MGLAHQHQVQNFVLGTPCLSRGDSGLHQASQIHQPLSLSRIQLSQRTPGDGCTSAVFNTSKISHCPPTQFRPYFFLPIDCSSFYSLSCPSIIHSSPRTQSNFPQITMRTCYYFAQNTSQWVPSTFRFS